MCAKVTKNLEKLHCLGFTAQVLYVYRCEGEYFFYGTLVPFRAIKKGGKYSRKSDYSVLYAAATALQYEKYCKIVCTYITQRNIYINAINNSLKGLCHQILQII